MARRLLKKDRLGYRGASLLALGIIFLLSGLPLLFDVNHFKPFQHPTSFGIPVWAGGFILAGIMSIVAAFRRNTRAQKIGYIALSSVGNSWVAFMVVLQIGHLFYPNHIPALGWLSIIENGSIMALIWIISGWDEPTEPLHLAERRKRDPE